jgi:putative chitinase
MTNWASIIRRISPNGKPAIIDGLAKAMPTLIARYNINTPLRQAHFLAQLAHESDGFRTTTEYASGSAYEGRRDLGNIYKGDGKKFKGRGLIQLTGRHNYRLYGSLLGVDFVANPKLAEQFPYAALTAGEYWKRTELNNLANIDDVNGITRRINGGFNGLADRKRFLEVAKLELDDTKMVQHRLTDLNYTLGSIDGKIGLQTRSAIRDFQDANGLRVTGNLDIDTRELLFAENAMRRPVSAHRAEITANELREEGSVLIEATDQAKVGSIGAGVATVAAVGTQVSSVATSVQQISDGVQQGMSLAQIASQYWPFIVAAIATIAACYFAYVAYKGAKKAEERRVYNARTGINLAR